MEKFFRKFCDASKNFAVVCLISMASTSGATNLLIIKGAGNEEANTYNHWEWGNFTGYITQAVQASGGTIAETDALSSEALGFDAVMLNQRWMGTDDSLSDGERLALANFAATGKKILMIGENQNWYGWNKAMLSSVGGDYSGITTNAMVMPAINHALTDGVTFLQLTGAGVAVGGTPLFSENFATLWLPNQNVLSVLDTNVFMDGYADQNSTQFARNVAQWLTTTPVPEPSTVSILLAGIALLSLWSTQRKSY